MQKDNISRPGKGLHTDNSYGDSPKDTYRLALNSVNETELGDFAFISNEESNELCTYMTEGFIPIGKSYIGNNETIIFSVKADNSVSEIGILKDTCEYEVHVNDSSSVAGDKLSFTIENQIQATYRLRRGCERTVYFTDNNEKPRYYNFDKPENFKNPNGTWNGPKFNLKKTIQIYPEIGEIEVLENSGVIPPGSYSVLFQYLDEEGNGTKFIELVDNINIINDLLTGNYSDIQGSTGLDVDHIKSLATGKAIRIKFSLLDLNYASFRLAIVKYTSGTGVISKVEYTAAISTSTPDIIYTGNNTAENGTIEEVELANLAVSIDRVGSIEQIDNKLILANVSGPQYNFCNLQKFASKIKTDVVVKDIILTSTSEEHNTKNPLVHYNGLSHQPGDIYSYGLVYIFEDLVESPVLHIPGKNNSLTEDHIFSPGLDVRPMRSSSNKNLSEYYINKNLCGTDDYWGLDSEGEVLTNTNVRHHRFPTRDEIELGFVSKISSDESVEYKQLRLDLLGILKDSVFCTPIEDTSCPEYYLAPTFRLVLKYKLNGISKEFTTTLISEINSDRLFFTNIFLSSDVLTDIELYYEETADPIVLVNIPLDIDYTSTLQDNQLTYKVSLVTRVEDNSVPKYEVPILGIKFSDIEIPSEAEANGKIIGYKIVRQERRDQDKTILDSAVILPMQHSNIGQGDFISAAMNTADLDSGSYPYDFSKNTVNILSPGHKFNGKTFDNFTTIEEVGKYNITEVQITGHSVQDVDENSSAYSAPDTLSNNTQDDDGFTMRQFVRCTKVQYNPSGSNKFFVDNVDSNMYALNAIESATHSNDVSIITNLSMDNKALILSKKSDTIDLRTYTEIEKKYPYVYIKTQNDFFYSNFENTPYYCYDNKIYTESICKSYHGDTHIAPLRYSTHVYGGAVQARRLLKQSIMDYIWVALAIIVAVIITIYSVGTATAAGVALVVGVIAASFGSALMVHAAHVKIEEFALAYDERWLKGLNFTLFDKQYQQLFYEPDLAKPREQLYFGDDTYKWYGEVIADFWFETPLNISLRVPFIDNNNNYLKPLKPMNSNRPDKFGALQQVERIAESRDGSTPWYRYIDFPLNFEGVEENYFAQKILIYDNAKWKYLTISSPVMYMLNNDHNIGKGIIKYYALPKEYDCCSECHEKFPHRWHWSEQSFQEELSDNYRVFLPNNYKDITGETGEITNVFKISNDLFIHTSEALYQIPRSYQERVTDQIVTFIGTGSYGELPERKIIDDDNGSSAGCKHKWATIKTPSGVFFISENQRKIYQFSQGQLKAISNNGLSNWFQNNIEIKNITHDNNPSNPIGSGFISTYDTSKERVIFTKRDTVIQEENLNNSWTISYSLRQDTWTSWHSYLPNFYINVPDKFYSFTNDNDGLWKHNVKDSYQTFYGVYHPHIIEYVSLSNPIVTRIWNHIKLLTEAKKYDEITQQYYDERFLTFNKAVIYNSRQCSGLLDLVVKDTVVNQQNYLNNQVVNLNNNSIIIDRNEKDWYINDLRDIRIDYTKPIWDSSLLSIQNEYYIDKVLNTSTLDINKDWTQLESFRDKYLVIRLIFDNFADVKLITNYSVENEQQSFT